MARRHARRFLALGLLPVLSACGPLEDGLAGNGGPQGGTAFSLAFADQLRPDVFSRSGSALREESDAPSGLWGVVPGLARPERALVENTASGASVAVSLYAGSTGSRSIAIRLSPQAADALGILDAPVPVRITALRSEPEIAQ